MATRGPKPKRREIRWSSELAYAVGLITTDGCLSSDKRHLILVSGDIEQIRNIKRCLKLKVKIGTHHSGRKDAARMYYRVQWGDVRLYSFLLDIGLTPKKSHTIGAMNIPDEFFFDFLRGHLDGDGSFYSYYDPRWRSSFMFYLAFVSASGKHLSWLQENIARLSGVRGHRTLTGRHGHKIHNLRYAKKEAIVLLARLYENPRAVSLSRKKLKIRQALAIVGTTLP